MDNILEPVNPLYYSEYRVSTHGELEKLIEDIMDAIRGESDAILYYEKLLTMARGTTDKEYIEHILNDEKDHLRGFRDLYNRLTGLKAEYKAKAPTISSYQNGLFAAYNDELEAYETYRNVILQFHDPFVRDTFFHAMSDEIDHASRLSFLYLQEQTHMK